MEQDIHDKLDRARAIATKNVKRATDGIREGAERVREGAERVGERARAAGSGAGETLGKAREQAGRAAGHANRIITEHPLAAAAAAVAVGAMAAYMFPKSSRKLRAAAPKLLSAAAVAGQKVTRTLAEQAKSKAQLPVEEAGHHLLEKFGDAARKAPGNAVDAARSGLETARAFAMEAARKAELEERAGKLLDAASEAASKMASRVRDHARRDTKGD